MGLLDDAIREHLNLKRRRGADPAEVQRAEREALGPVRRNPGPGDAPVADDPTDAAGGAHEEARPGYDETPGGYEEAPALYDDSRAGYDEAPGGYDESPGYDEPLTAHQTSPAAYDEPPAGREAADAYDAPGEDDWAEEPAASVEAPADADFGAEPPHGRGRPAGAERTDLAEAENWSSSDADPAGLEPFPTAPPVAPRGNPAARPAGLGPHSAEDEDLPDDATVEYRLEEPPVEEEGEDMLEETPEFLQDTPDHDRLWFEQRPPRDFDFDG